MKNYLAFDLGAESGRAILGTIDGGRLHLEELHRFPNQPVRIPAGLFWDAFRLFHEIQHGLSIAGREGRIELQGIGIDTWGVDFGLLGPDGALLDNPRHYRDARNNGMLERTFAVLPKEEIFAATGIQFLQLNSLYQLYAARLAGSPALDAASTLLFMPDLLSYWLSGVMRSEMSIASTSQFYDPARKGWATALFERLGLPTRILAEVVPSGTLLGPLLPWISQAAGLDNTPVYATCGHDTASAVAAVPAEGEDWAYISSGTWSLMGVELAEPIINDAALALEFTNELGAAGRVRFLKNITGLWLLQECRRDWALAGQDYGYAELTDLAAAAGPFPAIIDPDAFLEPGSLPARICAFCRETGQEPPAQPGAMARAILESLALRCRQVLGGLESLLGRELRVIHIVGGGSKNRLLNQFVSDATGKPVLAGPAEATAAGNILVQAIGSGAVSGLEEAREIVARSFAPERFEPQSPRVWDSAYTRFREIRDGRT
jgi:rhamnulokinase